MPTTHPKPATEPPPKTRITYALAALLIIALGLTSRHPDLPLPPFITRHAGDTLYAVMIYLALRALQLNARRRVALVGTLAFCFTIELAQRWQPDWLTALRATTPGRLVLGQGFLYADLARYTAGTLAAATLDHFLPRPPKPRPERGDDPDRPQRKLPP